MFFFVSFCPASTQRTGFLGPGSADQGFYSDWRPVARFSAQSFETGFLGPASEKCLSQGLGTPPPGQGHRRPWLSEAVWSSVPGEAVGLTRPPAHEPVQRETSLLSPCFHPAPLRGLCPPAAASQWKRTRKRMRERHSQTETLREGTPLTSSPGRRLRRSKDVFSEKGSVAGGD